MLNGRTRKALYEVRRIFVPLAVLCTTTILLDIYGVQNQWALRLHKANQVMSYVVLAHIIRSQIFPYIDLRTMYVERDPAFGQVFMGMMILAAAIILGGTLGL